MRYIIGLMIGLLCLFLFIIGYKKTKEALSPLCFFSFYFFITRVPKLLSTEINGYTGRVITDEMLLRYFFITLIFVMSATVVFVTNSKNLLLTSSETENSDARLQHLYRVGIFFFLIGAAAKVYLILQAGGIKYIWDNIIHRTAMVAGKGYIDYLSIYLMFGVAALEYCVLKDDKKRKKYRIALIVCTLVSAALLISFGARSPLLKLVFAVLFVWFFCSKKRKKIRSFFNWKIVILGVVICVFILIMPYFRSANADNYSFSDAVNYGMNSLLSIFDSISLYDEDVFVFDYFKKHERWYGKSYIDLIFAWIPSSLYSAKPPVDDGLYLKSLMLGFDVSPSMAVSELPVRSSVPFTSNGIAYANFGLFGSMLSGILTAVLINKQYYTMKKNGCKPEDVVFYQILCTRLVFSVKGLVELLMTLALYFVYKMIARIRLAKKKR